jgi:hypothetical protein
MLALYRASIDQFRQILNLPNRLRQAAGHRPDVQFAEILVLVQFEKL